MHQSGTYYLWDNLDINWENVDMEWEEVLIVAQVASALGSGGWDYSEVKKKIPYEQRQRFFNIVVKVNGLTYKDNREVVKNKKIQLNHIQNTFNKAGINITIDVKKGLNDEDLKINFDIT